jgi:hypothetical protein
VASAAEGSNVTPVDGDRISERNALEPFVVPRIASADVAGKRR